MFAMYLPKLTVPKYASNLDSCLRSLMCWNIRSPSRIVENLQLFIRYLPHWCAALAFLLVYIVVMQTLLVPDYSYYNPTLNMTVNVTCNVRGDLSPACNAARQVDLWIMGWNHVCVHV